MTPRTRNAHTGESAKKRGRAVIEETPVRRSSRRPRGSEIPQLTWRKCRLCQKSQKLWAPALVTPVGQSFEAEFSDGTIKELSSDSVLQLDIGVGDEVLLEGHGQKVFKVIELIKSTEKSPYRLESGVDSLAVEPLRGDQLYKRVPVGDLILSLGQVRASTSHSITEHTTSIHNKGIFSSCVFWVGTEEIDEELNEAVDTLVDNGAVLLADGITDLLEVDYEAMTASYTFSEHKTFGFALAHMPSTNLRYMQALAIGWPCVSPVFVFECIYQGRFIDNFLEFTLAAGWSVVLKSSKTADLSSFRELYGDDLDLSRQFEYRPLYFASIVPQVYVIANDTTSDLLKLMILLNTRTPPLVVDPLFNVPAGSVAIDLTDGDTPSLNYSSGCYLTPQEIRRDMMLQEDLEETVVLKTDWLYQSIINQRVV